MGFRRHRTDQIEVQQVRIKDCSEDYSAEYELYYKAACYFGRGGGGEVRTALHHSIRSVPVQGTVELGYKKSGVILLRRN